jgi:hypothetical protein
LKLASVSPALHEVYAEDGMTLDQLMAFTVSDDHARQEQVWERKVVEAKKLGCCRERAMERHFTGGNGQFGHQFANER